MKVERREGSTERTILTSMIVSTSVLGRLSTKWQKDGLFASQWSNIVAGWCVKYYQKYGKAPKRAIENLFSSWAQDREGDKETVKLVEKFLGALSGEYAHLRKATNAEYVIDLAGDYFNRVRLSKLAEAIQGDLDGGKSKEAAVRVQKFTEIETVIGQGIDLVTNAKEEIKAAVQDRKTSVLVRYPGKLGQFFGDSLEREGFISFLGREKIGKSYWLLDLAWRAMLQRRKVAFFEVGDLSKKQLIRRFSTRALGRPLGPTKPERPVKYPKEFTIDGSTALVIPENRKYKDWVSWNKIVDKFELVAKEKVKSKNSYLKLSIHPNSSITVAGVRSVLKSWEIGGWIPDIVIIDYADILATPAGFQGESRDAINDTWKAMRRMSQELHCLVATATQANAASYSSDNLNMSNFSEDKRKFSHVTAMFGINQTDPERKMGVQRLNTLVLREDEFVTSDNIWVAGCLAIANPAVKSLM